MGMTREDALFYLCEYHSPCLNEHLYDAMTIAIQELSNKLQSNGWVSVKDRLPEKLTLVLVCNHGIYDIAFVGDRGNWVNKLFEPEYWMPLPEPPKDGAE